MEAQRYGEKKKMDGYKDIKNPWYIYTVKNCVCGCGWVHSLSHVQLTLCNPMDYNPPRSSVHGVFQARKVE